MAMSGSEIRSRAGEKCPLSSIIFSILEEMPLIFD
jgi:hypothetical protein